jgi:hypothetical protein
MAIRLLRSVDAGADEPKPDQGVEACASLVFRVLAETGSGAAVLHTGDTPYLEVPNGEIELAKDRLTPAAIEALAGYFLSEAALRALRVDGSVQSEWRIMSELPNSRFTIVAALRQQDDLWIEVRHTRVHNPPAPAKPPAVRTNAHRNPAGVTRGASDDGLAVPSAEELWSR